MTASRVLVSTPPGTDGRYSLLLTSDRGLVRDAQRLRHRVFTTEMGATLLGDGVDEDAFDAFCEHLVVRDDAAGEVVGTYRVLPPDRAAAAGSLYAESEFDLAALAGLRERLVETGRSCVHPEHRSGAVVGLVWAGLARYMLLTGHRYLMGCASVPLADGGALAAAVRRRVEGRHLAPVERRVRPHVLPGVGAVAAWTGALFVDRARLSALPATVAGMADALRAGESVAAFPEGTTWCGARGGPFRPAAFQAAIDAGVPVRPVAVVLRGAGAPFVGDEDLVTALRRVLRARSTVCELTVLPPLAPTGDRRALAAAAASAIAGVTAAPHGRTPLVAV